jgi:hypothetical protein
MSINNNESQRELVRNSKRKSSVKGKEMRKIILNDDTANNYRDNMIKTAKYNMYYLLI